jgi:hypothetical protein
VTFKRKSGLLWTLFIDLDGRHFSAQLHAATPEDAISDFLDSRSIVDFARVCRRDAGQVIDDEELAVWPGTVTTDDIVLFVPQGINKFLCQFARAGKYISIILVRTVKRA